MKIMPIKISNAPIKSVDPKYVEVPNIMIPLITDITIETLSPCINFTIHNTVKNITAPPIAMTNHWKSVGTTMCFKGKNIGKHRLVKNMN